MALKSTTADDFLVVVAIKHQLGALKRLCILKTLSA
jgi:hypothetical protein